MSCYAFNHTFVLCNLRLCYILFFPACQLLSHCFLSLTTTGSKDIWQSVFTHGLIYNLFTTFKCLVTFTELRFPGFGKAGSVSWFLTHVCSNHPPLSKLVTSCTSKGIWFIRGATPQDFERPLTCLSKLTFLAISIYFLFALSCCSAGMHPLAAGVIVHQHWKYVGC